MPDETVRNGKLAEQLANTVVQGALNASQRLDGLAAMAAAQAAQGNFEAAKATAQKGIKLAKQSGNALGQVLLQRQLEQNYEQGKPIIATRPSERRKQAEEAAKAG